MFRSLAMTTVALLLLGFSATSQVNCDPVTGSNWLVPLSLGWTANLTGAGDNYALTWDGCETQSFCFVPKGGGGPPMWGSTDLTGWKISAKIGAEMAEDGGSADPLTKTLHIATEVIDGLNADPAVGVVVITHEMYHVAIANNFPEFDAHYGVCTCPALCENGATKESHPQCYACTWLNEQVASCTTAQSICCQLGDATLTGEERSDLEDALDLAKLQCERDLEKAPFGHTGCPVNPKPMAPMNAPMECPPSECPTAAMAELEGEE